MLSRPVYEALPYTYIALGSISLMLLEQTYAQLFAALLFLLGSRVDVLRSCYRRTDSKKRRRKGKLPTFIYEHTPYLYLLTALLLLKLDSKLAPVFSIALVSYALYIFARRTMNRKHKTVTLQRLEDIGNTHNR
ncbi:conserved hypothetical protein [Shewanella halifaxensis HAW-EB4]|uniref:Uncharacterized protein n=1 Tax=Shewanella halifaxensis (strain HAW-EB4) TaxID=458817 RepID=B0TJ90_SHEHH|nr:hypothetical protein [Shewanella halifaxensis]ABZ75681.1 conserved hypothetical protein [Shewanella halifaxensis HAW-EB4]